VLDPAVQGTHLKAWTLAEMVWTDFSARGVPWVELLLGGGASASALNLGWRHRLSAVASLAAVGGFVLRRPALTAAGAGVLVVLNAPFYALLARRRGAFQATLGVALHAAHHLTAVASVPAGAASFALRRSAARAEGP
jgi:hypothetical protein